MDLGGAGEQCLSKGPRLLAMVGLTHFYLRPLLAFPTVMLLSFVLTRSETFSKAASDSTGGAAIA